MSVPNGYVECYKNSITCLWQPSCAPTNISQFMRTVNSCNKLDLKTYEQLHKWSITEYRQFWELWWKVGGFICSKQPTAVVAPHTNISDRPEWFVGAQLNFAENLLRFRDDNTAIIATGEGVNQTFRQSYKELFESSQQWARAFRDAGLRPGSRVAACLPNCPAAVHALLGAATVGAVWCSASPDFGVKGVLDRFGQVEPEVLLMVDAVRYNGKVHDQLIKVEEVAAALPTVRRVVLVPFVKPEEDIDITAIPNSVLSSVFLSCKDPQDVPFVQLPASHPLFIMFSSGTTGPPKCIVHGAAGTLVQITKEHSLHCDLSRDDVFMYYTSTGWMMWQWLVVGLYTGCTLLLYDGSPLLPHSAVLWDMVDHYGITVLGTGAKWLSVLESRLVRPAATHSLASLRCVLSTGSPLTERSFRYVYECVKKNVLLGSISGGTDILSCFVGCCPLLPVHAGEVQVPLLGMGVEVWGGEDGRSPLWDEAGELVCTVPFPSMPTHFWGEAGDEKYRKAYFAQREGVWSHGDYCLRRRSTGGLVMLGRSDGTLNPSGVRFGSAEIYGIDCVCVGQRRPSDGEERVVLFLKMVAGKELTEALKVRVKEAVRRQLSARHVPAVVLQAQDIPYTCSGKKVEVAVRQAIHGETVPNTTALANPATLDLYRDLPELRNW